LVTITIRLPENSHIGADLDIGATEHPDAAHVAGALIAVALQQGLKRSLLTMVAGPEDWEVWERES
jgi:hypothetical protein